MESFWMNVLHQVILYVIQIAVAALLVWVHSLLPIAQRWMKNHLSERERALLQQVGKEAFVFAETAYKEFDGPGKLNQALHYASAVADKHGLKVSSAELRAAIEQGWWDAQGAQAQLQDKEKQP